MDVLAIPPPPEVQSAAMPPPRISEAPSVRNLQPRRVSAVRRWPSGCGRLPSPSDLPLPPPLVSVSLSSCSPPVSLTATGTGTGFGTDDVVVVAAGAAQNPLSHSNAATAIIISPHDSDSPAPAPPFDAAAEGKIHNLPAVYGGSDSVDNGFKPEAVEEAPNGNILTESDEKAKEEEEKVKKVDFSNKRWINSKIYPPPKRRSTTAVRRYPTGCGTDQNEVENRNWVVVQDENESDKMFREISVPVEENKNQNSLECDNSVGRVDANVLSGIQGLPVNKKEDSMEEIILSGICPGVCAKKSVADPSRPSLTEANQKKKGRKVAKKSIRPVNDDSPRAWQPDLMTLTLPPVNPSDGERLFSARSKVKKILRLFQGVCRMLIRCEESGSGKQPQKDETASQSKLKGHKRIDLRAEELVKKSDEYVHPGDPVVGHLLGVEVGDEFRYRVELHLIGLHRSLQSGIDWTKVNGVPVATSIVASGGYSDDWEGSDVLNYTGAGGKPTGKKGKRSKPEDQKLERGNLALKNSMDMKMPVRVIYGLNTSDTSKVVMTFTYDGLYMVEGVKSETETYKFEGQKYKVKVFRFRLRMLPGQPELGLHVAAKCKKSKVREGLCVPDISQGMEKIPICAINTIDEENPPAFRYITNMIYPSRYEKTAPKGCDCTGNCSSSKRCLCALKNGGEIPFNFSGAIVQAKQLIYECGPSCRCPPSCHNRVSQNGIKIPLEIFKTENRGWGVRSLSSIPSGSFVCEYVGELLRDEVAERRGNDEYLFDIGHRDVDLQKGLPGLVPGINSTEDYGANASKGLTIDAAEMGNVSRFINHCCSPNLYAQNVLFDHHDRRMPHIMFFAAENIPPLQELTYHYNYDIGQVRDSQGNVKIKKCYCGSLECKGRLY